MNRFGYDSNLAFEYDDFSLHNLFEIQREQLALLRKMELRLNKSTKDQEPKTTEL